MKKSVDSEKYFETASDNLILLGLVFDNGCFVAITEKSNFKLGTTALSLPISSSDRSSHAPPTHTERSSLDRRDITTATVIGSRNEIYTKALAEKITLATQGLVYLSVNFQEEKEELFLEALKLVEEFIKEKS